MFLYNETIETILHNSLFSTFQIHLLFESNGVMLWFILQMTKTEKFHIIWYLSVLQMYYRCQLQLPLLSFNCLFNLYQMSVVSQTATFPIDCHSLYLSGTSHQHISCSPAAGSTSKSWFQLPCGHIEWCFSMEILTNQSRRGQSRCPAVWPPHAAQKDLSCWGADRAWTTRPWAGHRADILRSSPERKKKKRDLSHHVQKADILTKCIWFRNVQTGLYVSF